MAQQLIAPERGTACFSNLFVRSLLERPVNSVVMRHSLPMMLKTASLIIPSLAVSACGHHQSNMPVALDEVVKHFAENEKTQN